MLFQETQWVKCKKIFCEINLDDLVTKFSPQKDLVVSSLDGIKYRRIRELRGWIIRVMRWIIIKSCSFTPSCKKIRLSQIASLPKNPLTTII